MPIFKKISSYNDEVETQPQTPAYKFSNGEITEAEVNIEYFFNTNEAQTLLVKAISSTNRASGSSRSSNPRNSPTVFSIDRGLVLNPSLNVSMKAMQPTGQIHTKQFDTETDVEMPTEGDIEP